MRNPVPYPPIERHGIVGDRRTAALVAGDGTIDWLCLRDYDDDPLFAALIDADRGGAWRIGPARPRFGRQHYVEDTAVLSTIWSEDDGELELTDAMPWPDEVRPAADVDRRVVIRRLRCTGGRAECRIRLEPRDGLVPDLELRAVDGGAAVRLFGRRDVRTIGVWSSQPLRLDDDRTGASARFLLRDGESAWMVLAADESPKRWSAGAAERALQATISYWKRWTARFEWRGRHAAGLRRSVVTTHLLAYAPSGAMVAAPTLGLPERVGGPRNYDYRFAWVRDASLSAASLVLVGDNETAQRYLRWLCGLDSSTDSPLQVAYDVHGRTRLRPQRLRRAYGYRGSRPVVVGNRAYRQRQLGSLGYLADCMALALEHGVEWRPEYSNLLRRMAAYTCDSWAEPDSGIWELGRHQQFVVSKVMSWVVLERASRLARRLGGFAQDEVRRWQQVAGQVRSAVVARGYGESLGAFRQRYDHDSVDASALLIPLVGFLPPDDPRVLSTLDRLEDVLGFEGSLYRFEPEQSEGEAPLPVGQFEGAFLPCAFWMVAARALAGQIDRAEALLTRAEQRAGELGLFPEEIDPRTGEALGNYPLLFSHVEHVRAVVLLERARRGIRPPLASGAP
ncbi:MAG TPA: glycoside hydrolase family 15 protein [Polyangiaceae bacterium]|nr:glycoside hydrolase family 15 protein [Polyangiaceae bacterium]